jgi:hypothetical protein
MLCFTMLSSLATTIFTIFLGTLQLSASAYGSTDFESDLSAATASTLLIAFVLGVHLILGYKLSWPKYKFRGLLSRPPASMAAVIPYVVFSPKLRKDLEDAAMPAAASTTDRIDKRYGFGEFKKGDKTYLGVERHSSSFFIPSDGGDSALRSMI